MPEPVENVDSGSLPPVHVAFEQTWKVTVPVSLPSGSLNVAVRDGVAVFTCAAFAGVTSVGVLGDALVVLFVIEALLRVAVAAWLPAAVPLEVVAVSRTSGVAPGFV